MTIYQTLIDEEHEGFSEDNFEVSITEKKLPKLFVNISKLFKNVIEIQTRQQMKIFNVSKINERTLVIFYDFDFTINELYFITKLYSKYNVSIVYCNCSNINC